MIALVATACMSNWSTIGQERVRIFDKLKYDEKYPILLWCFS